MRIIRQYNSRKMYDPVVGQYIGMNHIRHLLATKTEFAVQTMYGEDATREVLLYLYGKELAESQIDAARVKALLEEVMS